ncbi:DUF6328 family protein, partial [Streptomyces alfalfae]
PRGRAEVGGGAGRVRMWGVVFVVVAVGWTLRLILRSVSPGPCAGGVAAAVMLWFGICWYALPLRLRRRAARRSSDDRP